MIDTNEMEKATVPDTSETSWPNCNLCFTACQRTLHLGPIAFRAIWYRQLRKTATWESAPYPIDSAIER